MVASSLPAPERRADKPRRTQQERREGTIRKLLDSATDTLIEVGYFGATVQEISKRAGVSQGGLFRHFASREALMVAVGEDIGKKILDHYVREFAELKDSEEPLRLALRLVREHCRSRLNQAWYELEVAARTDANLRKALRPVAAKYHRDIEQLARELLPDLAEQLGDRFPVLLDTILSVFDGETVRRFVLKTPAVDDARIDFLLSLLR